MPPLLREQIDAERFLNELHLMANRRVREAQLVGRIADALVARGGLKPFERLQGREFAEFDFVSHTIPRASRLASLAAASPTGKLN